MATSKTLLISAYWNMLERFLVQLVQFVTGILIARALSPAEYGIVGIVLVIITVLQIFVDSGFSKALIHKTSRTDEDISTVFFFNILIALVSYGLLALSAPFLSSFYKIPVLSQVVVVLGATLIINAIYATPNTLLLIKMDFKAIAKVNLVSILVSGAVGIYMAYSGYGIWALVVQNLVRGIVSCIMVAIQLRWRPSITFSKLSIKHMSGYGLKILSSSLLNVIATNISSLLIAKIINAKELGYYSRGIQFADFVYILFSSVLDNILLPGLTGIKDDAAQLKTFLQKIVRTVAVVIIPVFVALIVLAKPLIIITLTEKWLPAAPVMQVICLARLITILSGINVNILYVTGRTDLLLKQQVAKVVIRVVLIVSATPFGIVAVAVAELVSTIIHYFINIYSPSKLLNFSIGNQLRDIVPALLAGSIFGGAIYLMHGFFASNIFFLVLTVVLSLPFYVITLWAMGYKPVSLVKSLMLRNGAGI